MWFLLLAVAGVHRAVDFDLPVDLCPVEHRALLDVRIIAGEPVPAAAWNSSITSASTVQASGTDAGSRRNAQLNGLCVLAHRRASAEA